MRVHSDITTLISRVVSVAELLERSQVMHLSNNLNFRADGCRLVRDNSHVSLMLLETIGDFQLNDTTYVPDVRT